MAPYEFVADVFKKVTVWYDDPAELYFYRWAWERISPLLDESVSEKVYALLLAYVYAEFCYYVCDANFYEDLWDGVDEFFDGESMELGFVVGRFTDEDECPTSCESAVHILMYKNYENVIKALSKLDVMDLLYAFHASKAKPQKTVIDEDGDEDQEDLITDYESFCRYVSDSDFRAEDNCGMFLSDYETAYDWWMCGAEMLEVRTTSDKWD